MDREAGMRTQVEVLNPAECCAPLARPHMSLDHAEGVATLLRALGDASRVRIFNLLATSDEPICVCELVEPLGLSQGTVSFHLKKLLQAGLIEREQRGTWAYYSVRPGALGELANVFRPEGARR
jgi:ArsR family transcriptional regulator, arsenate/arsenite/antimonite-responsive transcriptional repressor